MAAISERYQSLTRARNAVLKQAREASRLTIPGLIPEEGSSDPHDVNEQPWSSLGARGVNNLAAKLLVSQFPPLRPFFRLEIDAGTAEEMGSKLGPAEEALASVSHMAMTMIEGSGSRPLWMEVFRHLVVAGNALVYHPDDGSVMRFWRLDQFVVRRDAQGKLIEAIIEEEVYPAELDDEVRAAVELDEDTEKEEGKLSDKSEQKVKLYTAVLREGDQIVHYQEINNIEVPGSRGTANADVAGWQALRWQAVPGSDYGRSMVSEYAGDFKSLEEGWAAVIKFAAEAARILTFVDPNSGIDVEQMASAESGDVLTGRADDIGRLQLDKGQDFNTLWNVLDSIERRLSQAFLLTANTIRDAERVTAAEIRAVAQELEDTFGGTYSVLSTEAQTPYARRVLHILSKMKKAPDVLKSKDIAPVIVTGFAALGQNHETVAIFDWIVALKNAFGDTVVAERVDFDEVAFRTGTGRGITDVDGLLKSSDQIAAEQEGQMNAQATQQVVPEIAKGAMNALNTAAKEASNGEE